MTRPTPVIVKIDRDASEKLRFIQNHLNVRPPLTGMVNDAVTEWLYAMFARHPEIQEAWDNRRQHLHLWWDNRRQHLHIWKE